MCKFRMEATKNGRIVENKRMCDASSVREATRILMPGVDFQFHNGTAQTIIGSVVHSVFPAEKMGEE